MIVLDTSAVVAIFRKEDEAVRFVQRIAAEDETIMSAANLLETSIVLRGLKAVTAAKLEQWLDDFIVESGIRIESVTSTQAQLARSAHARFGKGTGHRAGLNYGDCFAYALAKAMNAPLLCKGDDFPLTDIDLA